MIHKTKSRNWPARHLLYPIIWLPYVPCKFDHALYLCYWDRPIQYESYISSDNIQLVNYNRSLMN